MSTKADLRGPRGTKGWHHSEETKAKIRRAKLGRKTPAEVGMKISRSLTGKRLSSELREKLSETTKRFWAQMTEEEKKEHLSKIHEGKLKKRHDKAILEELENLRKQGFKAVPLGLSYFPKPDILAIKGEMLYAVEVDLTHAVHYFKYNGYSDFFNDVIWVRKWERR